MPVGFADREAPRTVAGICVAAFAGIVGLYTFNALSHDVWDDALFFERFGVNIVEHHVAAWNVDEGPVYGNTSQLFQFLAAAVVAVAPNHYHFGIKLVLGLSLFIAFVISGVVVRQLLRLEAGAGDAGPPALLLCGFAAPTMLLMIASGMDTLPAICVLALFFAIVGRVYAEGFHSRIAESASFTGAQVLIYLARPDLIAITIPVSAIVLWKPDRKGQRRFATLLGLSFGGILIAIAILRGYYGTALPLSFYVKSRLLSPYDQDYQLLGVAGERRQLMTWLVFTGVFAYIALFRLRRWSFALLGGAAAFVAYHAVSTIGIMGYHTRFFLPASLPIILAAAAAWRKFSTGKIWWKIVPILAGYPLLLIFAYQVRRIEAWDVDFYLGWLEPRYYAAFTLPTLTLVAAPLFGRLRTSVCAALVPLLTIAAAAWAVPPHSPDAIDDQTLMRRMALHSSAFTGLYTVKRCVQEPTHLYHSELGLPGVLFPRSRITDLTGLMNPQLVFERAAFDDYCLEDPPEVLFLPHWTHLRLNAEIEAGQCIQQYTRPHGIPPSSSTLYIRRDLVADFDRCQLRLEDGRAAR
jgi:hypothetical protein